MASVPEQPQMKKTLGLTGLTMNAMALIAPGAFLWLTFRSNRIRGPMAGSPSGSAFWRADALLCHGHRLRRTVELYPGAGSSYFFAEQAFFSKTNAYKFARISKFVIGWASHLYYWVYPGVMVGVTAILVGYLAGQFFPNTFNGTINSPTLMIGFCILFSFGVAYIAYRGVAGTTGVNIAINIIQITALLIFSVIAFGYRLNHGEGSVGSTLDPDGNPIKVVQATARMPSPRRTTKGAWKVIKNGHDEPLVLSDEDGGSRKSPARRQAGRTEASHLPISRIGLLGGCAALVQLHVQSACIAILILVGLEWVTSMGEEAPHAKRDIPRAVLLSLFIQGFVCYLIEYFAPFPQPGYTMATAASSSAPIGDMMVIVGTGCSAAGGRLVVHVHSGDHGVPGPHRHHALLHLYGGPGDVRDGSRRRGVYALWHVARQEFDAAPGHLDPGRRFGGDGDFRGLDVSLRPGCYGCLEHVVDRRPKGQLLVSVVPVVFRRDGEELAQ